MKIDARTLENARTIVDIYRNKVVFVSGATGMLGQNTIALLLAMNDVLNAGITVIAHGRNQEKMDRVFAEYKNRSDLHYYLSDVSELAYPDHIDFIVHTASVTGGSKQHLDFPMRTISTALGGAKSVLDLALKNGAAAIFLSSLEVYGFTGSRESNIAETDGGYIDCTNVRSSYSESKRMCECMFASYAKQYGVKTYIARLTATFGSGASPSDNRVFAQFARSIIEKKNIVLKSTGASVRDYCDAEDAAMAFLYIMAKGNVGEAYNVANMETEISIKDMASRFVELYPESNSELIFDLSEDATKLGYNAVMRNVVDSTKLYAIGWKPVFNMDDMIRHLVSSIKG